MIEVECLAHRGFWRSPSEKNSIVAFERAFTEGYGVEVDLRDHDGSVVISHDPPLGTKSKLQTFEEFLQQYKQCGASGTLALNIKAVGLSGSVQQLLSDLGVVNYFVFDMAIPDMIGYLDKGMRCFARHSEYELPTLFGDGTPHQEVAGVWLDSFSSIWYQVDLIREYLVAGLDLCVVSPELHGRDPHSFWGEIKQELCTKDRHDFREAGRLMLCTDFPDKF